MFQKGTNSESIFKTLDRVHKTSLLIAHGGFPAYSHVFLDQSYVSIRRGSLYPRLSRTELCAYVVYHFQPNSPSPTASYHY